MVKVINCLFIAAVIVTTAGCSIFRLSHTNASDPLFVGNRTNETFTLTDYYPFNSNANDESGYGHDGEISNAFLTNDRFGSNDKAYYFNGNGVIYFNTRLSLDNRFTLMFWIKDDSSTMENRRWIATTTGIIYSANFVMREEPDFGATQVYVGALGYSSTNYTFNSGFWKDGNWHFYAAVSDGTKTEIYYDSTNIMTINDSVVPQSGLYAGGYYYYYLYGYSEYFVGFMDDIRIFNGPLSQSDISSYYHENGW